MIILKPKRTNSKLDLLFTKVKKNSATESTKALEKPHPALQRQEQKPSKTLQDSLYWHLAVLYGFCNFKEDALKRLYIPFMSTDASTLNSTPFYALHLTHTAIFRQCVAQYRRPANKSHTALRRLLITYLSTCKM